MSNLRVYPGTEHPHEAQQPEKLDVAAMNPKNTQYKKITPKTKAA
jgi:large subunit ribosomal protein L13